MPLIDPIEILSREDKWYLGNGGMLLYAPPFPKHLRTPGFWDECHFGDLAVERLLCVSFAAELLPKPEAAAAVPLDLSAPGPAPLPPRGEKPGAHLVELEPHLSHWRWYPDRIEARHYLVIRDGVGYKQQRGVRIFVNEIRSIGPDSTLHVKLSFEVLAGCEVRALHIVGWTARQSSKEAKASHFSDLQGYGNSITYRQQATRRAHGRGDKPVTLDIAMQGDPKPQSIEATPAHGATLVPELRFTPFWDSLKGGSLSGKVQNGNVLGSVMYAGLHWKVRLAELADKEIKLNVKVADSKESSSVGELQTKGGYHQSLATPDPAESWREFMSLVPHFECSSEMLTRYYWYRWYGMRLNAVPPGGSYKSPAVTEGISYFRGVITYSLMCHVYEAKWLSDPALAKGCLENHIVHQARAGHFPGHIYYGHVNKKGFYHTDVGRSVGELLAHHPDSGFAEEIYKPLARLLNYYVRHRDKEGLDLYDVRDQYETGQEFTSRYFHSDNQADTYGWEHKLKLKGIDVTTYVYHLALLLARLARDAGKRTDLQEYTSLGMHIKAAVQELLWDDDRRFFFDYNVATKELSPYKTLVGLWPLISDLATDEQALLAAEYLDDPQHFATPWPAPASPVNDDFFSAAPYWRGERANCPWNGRVWPMNNSHVVEVLARLSRAKPDVYRPKLAGFLTRFIELMHFENQAGAKDITRPNCFEHYSPEDGTACGYRGIDDYMHSWVADLILKYTAGVRFEDGRLIVDPLPFNLDWFLLKDCHIAGHRLSVGYNRSFDVSVASGFWVMLDGQEIHRSDAPQKIEVEI